MKKEGEAMKLPRPKTEGTVSVERVIQQRRTVRAFDPKALELNQLSQLLWAAQGITGRRGFKRAAPSAGALYPMDLYAAIGSQRVHQLEAGVYHYVAAGHMLERIADKDVRSDVARASLSQMWMAGAPLNLVITAAYHRVTGKYGERGVHYALIEAGHVGQNLFLQAEALGLKAGIVGAFHDRRLAEVLLLPVRHEPLLIMPIGYAA
jgi:SagB-type dehydrogenase family enzyme